MGPLLQYLKGRKISKLSLFNNIYAKFPTKGVIIEVESHVNERLKREGVTNEGAVQMAYYFIRRQLQQ